jgi:23S rRNA pseudouridine955/2504/2580 synthase
MHLHARRLRIEHPEGDLLDVTAPLPDHFAATMAQLGFEEADGDLPLEPVKLVPDKVFEKRAAKAHAKEYRKERRGERRKRADAPPSGRAEPKARAGVKKGPGSKAPTGTALARASAGRAAAERNAAERAANGGKPVRRAPPKTGPAKSGTGRSGAGRPDSGRSGTGKPPQRGPKP